MAPSADSSETITPASVAAPTGFIPTADSGRAISAIANGYPGKNAWFSETQVGWVRFDAATSASGVDAGLAARMAGSS